MRHTIALTLAVAFGLGVARAQEAADQVELSGRLEVGSTGDARIGPIRLVFAGGLGLRDDRLPEEYRVSPDGDHTAVVKGQLRQEGSEVVLRVEFLDVRTGSGRVQFQLRQEESRIRRGRADALEVEAWGLEAAGTTGPVMTRLLQELPRAGDQATYRVRGYAVSKGSGLGSVSFTPRRVAVLLVASRVGEEAQPGAAANQSRGIGQATDELLERPARR